MATQIYTDGITVQGQPAGTYGPTKITGGLYALSAVGGATTPTVQITMVPGPDGATNLPVLATALASPGYTTIYLQPGEYSLTLAGGTAPTGAALTRIKLT